MKVPLIVTIAFVITSVAVQSYVIKDSAADLIQPQANKKVAKRATDIINNYNYGTQYGWPGNGGSDQRPMPIHGGPHHGGPHHGGQHHGGQLTGGPYPIIDPVPYRGSSNTEHGISGAQRYSVSTYPSYEGGVTIYKPNYGVTIERKETIYPGSGYQRITYPGSGYGGHTSYQPGYGGHTSYQPGYGGHTSYQPGYGGHNSGQFGYREAINSHRHNAPSDPIDDHSSYRIPTIMRRGVFDEDTSTPSTTINFPDS